MRAAAFIAGAFVSPWCKHRATPRGRTRTMMPQKAAIETTGQRMGSQNIMPDACLGPDNLKSSRAFGFLCA